MRRRAAWPRLVAWAACCWPLLVAEVAARRVADEPDAAAWVAAPGALATVCYAGGFDFLIGLEDFESVQALAAWCADGHEIAAHALVNSGLRHQSDWARGQAVAALGDRIVALAPKDPGSAVAFLEHLSSERMSGQSGGVRQQAVETLGGIPGRLPGGGGELVPRCVAALSEGWLRDADPLTRASAAEALGAVAPDAMSEQYDLGVSIVLALRLLGKADRSCHVRMATTTAFGKAAIAAARAPFPALAITCVEDIGALSRDGEVAVVRMVALDALGSVAHKVRSQRIELARRCEAALAAAARSDVSRLVSQRAERILRMLGRL